MMRLGVVQLYKIKKDFVRAAESWLRAGLGGWVGWWRL